MQSIDMQSVTTPNDSGHDCELLPIKLAFRCAR